MTHEEIMVKVWAEIEADGQRHLQALYGTNEAVPETQYSAWMPLGIDASEARHSGKYGDRHIHGIASTPRPSVSAIGNKLSLQSDGVEARLPVPLLSGHQTGKAIGEVYYLRRSREALYVKAAIFDTPAADFAWDLIEAGTISCFSVLSSDVPGTDKKSYSIVEGCRFMDRWQLNELSLVKEGANSDCRFEILREGDGNAELPNPFLVEKSPSIPYAGVWKKEARYRPGQFVTHAGSLWHAEIESVGVSPGDAPAIWKLAVKRGRAEVLK